MAEKQKSVTQVTKEHQKEWDKLKADYIKKHTVKEMLFENGSAIMQLIQDVRVLTKAIKDLENGNK